MSRNTFVLKIQRELCHPKSFGTFEKRVPGACFSKVPKLFGCISGDIILFVSSKLRRLEARNFAFLVLFSLQHMKRPALQNKQVGVLRMAFRERKVFGTFEKRAPGSIHELTRHLARHCSSSRCWRSYYSSGHVSGFLFPLFFRCLQEDHDPKNVPPVRASKALVGLYIHPSQVRVMRFQGGSNLWMGSLLVPLSRYSCSCQVKT